MSAEPTNLTPAQLAAQLKSQAPRERRPSPVTARFEVILESINGLAELVHDPERGVKSPALANEAMIAFQNISDVVTARIRELTEKLEQRKKQDAASPAYEPAE